MMKAILPKDETLNADITMGKELVRTHTIVALHKGDLYKPVNVQWYMGRSRSATAVYCVVGVYTKEGKHHSGTGRVTGGGYHKESAAFAVALSAAGIRLIEDGKPADLYGAGDYAIDQALEALTRAAGYRGKTILV